MITKLIAVFRERLDKSRRYKAALAEIAALNQRDLRDLRADPTEMQRAAYEKIFGSAA